MILLSLVLCLPGFAAEPKEVVQEIFAKASAKEIIADVKKQDEINALVDFDALAVAALGKEAKTVGAKEVEWFKQTLKSIITLTVYPKAPEFLDGVQISYEPTKEVGAKAKIMSAVQKKADATEVEYVLEKSKAGQWRVVDVSISGLSWVESIRDQVKDVVKKKKWKGVKDAMNRRLQVLKAGKSV